MTAIQAFDDTQPSLGDRPLWHPRRGQPSWFDISVRRPYGRSDAGRIVRDRLPVASAAALIDVNVETGARQVVRDPEADGCIFSARVAAAGQAEHRVIL